MIINYVYVREVKSNSDRIFKPYVEETMTHSNLGTVTDYSSILKGMF